ncbi:dethiobiotin synthase [Kangiella sp. HZ709]|uniref:dethiobiotin synthase n=1 Tax=Kangiella sp. HZ709 TaxID=2666328 RepID=UPI0012AF4357|nr:dethiobiotin synthase [Kangiella sp. HZ709]MRX28617.1 dethiobiotin synthase [Kangiella sp. HZ709]
MTKTYFVTGTDTEIGKTFATHYILKALADKGHLVAGLKPIASDSQFEVMGSYSGLVNSDAKQLMKASSLSLKYSQVNPLVFADPIAPHIAAKQANVDLNCASLSNSIIVPDAELVLIEGAGGWLTPLNESETYADWVAQNNYEVILVVGMKLGCLNHAQLTAESIRAKGLSIKGWVANQLTSDMQVYRENLDWLENHFSEPLLAEIEFQADSENPKIQQLDWLLN